MTPDQTLYRRRHHRGWCQDHPEQDPCPPEIRLQSESGTLVLRPGGTQWTPNPGAPPPVVPVITLEALPDIVVTRATICSTCPELSDAGCAKAGCACRGLARPTAADSRCPEGKW